MGLLSSEDYPNDQMQKSLCVQVFVSEHQASITIVPKIFFLLLPMKFYW